LWWVKRKEEQRMSMGEGNERQVAEEVAAGFLGNLWAVAGDPEEKRGRKRGRALTGKQRGEIAEAEFMAKAARLGFGVAKPWGDSHPYDFIVQAGGRLWKVQVKSAYRAGEDGGYSFHTHGHSLRAYRPDEIDVLVAYAVPEQAWYVFPVGMVQRLRSLKLFPGSRKKRSKFEKYREAWGMLTGE
jgi:hypothetical protein